MSRPGGSLDADTTRAYLSRVRQFLTCLANAAIDGDPLNDPAARDWAVRDYRTWLLTVAKRKLSTVGRDADFTPHVLRHNHDDPRW